MGAKTLTIKSASVDGGATPFVPDTRALAVLADAVGECRGCALYRNATQAVFGAGPTKAPMMLVGEQPGDQEDRAGRPFVGPAGRLLDKALVSAGIDRELVYVTNAVKHFKFHRAEGQKRRIHQTPSRAEVVACRPWLLAELGALRPDVVVLLGATAAKSLMGGDFRITAHRGDVLDLPAPVDVELGIDPDVVVSIHPSAILRAPSHGREAAYEGLLTDLRLARSLLPL